jgi:hypothetical protein
MHKAGLAVRVLSAKVYFAQTVRRWSFRRIGWLWAVGSFLLFPAASYAGQISTDFDGDGIADVVRLRESLSTVIEVWLSSSQKVTEIQTKGRTVHVVASDLNGDGRPEIVVADGKSRVRVWRLGSGELTPVQRRKGAPRKAPLPSGDEVDDGPNAPAPADQHRTTVQLPLAQSVQLSFTNVGAVARGPVRIATSPAPSPRPRSERGPPVAIPGF